MVCRCPSCRRVRYVFLCPDMRVWRVARSNMAATLTCGRAANEASSYLYVYGPDGLDPALLKLSAHIIVEPITYIFNLSRSSNDLPDVWKSVHVLPLLKGGDPSILDNYRPISKLSVLAKVLESLINTQLKGFLQNHNILSPVKSGFRAKHSTITAAVKVLDDIICDLHNKMSFAALFIDLSKAFETVDHCILFKRLRDIGLGTKAVDWFRNYLANRTQTVAVDGHISASLGVRGGVPQGSILGLVLFTIYINTIASVADNGKIHLYADDTVLYCSAPTLAQAYQSLQQSFNLLQATFIELRLVLNAGKTKVMQFTKSRTVPSSTTLAISTLDGKCVENVSSYKYLGLWIDEKLTFKVHIDKLVRKLRVKLGFYFRNKSCFTLQARRKLISATFLPVFDYGDVIYMHAASTTLHTLDTVYHGALRFIINAKSRTHHCRLYEVTGFSSLGLHRWFHWHIFIYKAISGDLPAILIC
uniref:Reverse transcriptase domain-containing protein n=1 Tax=Cyprinus carpio TaxID=7962 RepID=A0A8C1PPA9_CYPCA